MGAAETLTAAIEKLEALRQASTVGPWSTWANPTVEVVAIVSETAADDEFVADYLDGPDAELILTLHRTIDAQLVILRYIHHDAARWEGSGLFGLEIDEAVIGLASAIVAEVTSDAS